MIEGMAERHLKNYEKSRNLFKEIENGMEDRNKDTEFTYELFST